MAKEQQIIAMQAEVAITAADAAEDGKPKGPPKFDVVAYTGGAMNVRGYDAPVVVDLSGMQFGNSLIANLDHDSSKRVGHVTETNKADGQLKLGGVVSAATDAAREVVESAANGFVWQASIEAQPSKLIEVAAGKTVTVNGQEFDGPLYVARKSTLKGFAFVSHGADDNTSATIAAGAASNKEKGMDKELKAFIEAMLPGVDVDSLSDGAVENLKAQFEGQAASKKKKPTASDRLKAREDEADRVEAIQDYADALVDKRPYDRDYIAAVRQLTEEAIEGKWSVDKFRLEALEASIPAATNFIPRSKDRNGKQLNNRVIEAAICMAGKLPDIDKAFSDQELQAAHDQFKYGIGLKQLLVMGAEANGHRSMGGEVTLETQRAAFGMLGPREIRAAGGFSTITIPDILSNSANKFLFRGFNAVDSTWSRISSRRNVRDFKQVTTATLYGALQYEKVGPTGEVKHGTVDDQTYTNQAHTYSLMLAINREMIINDDLGALSDVPMKLGRGAVLKINDVFWTEFLDNSSFFTSGNGNVSTGAGSALGSADGAAINAAEVKFLNQTGPDGKPLGIMPKLMLVPPTLKNTAARWMGSQLFVGSTGLGDSNIFGGRYTVESSPYMENTSYTGNSTAAWYLLADPAELSTIEIAFLNGRDTPMVETAEADFNTLGIQMRGVIDFGVNLQEYRAGVRSAGS